MKVLDISVNVFQGENNIQDIAPRIQNFFSLEKGDEFNLTAIYMGLQTATHVLTPSFCFEDEKTIEDFELETFIGSCEVIKLPSGYITGEMVERLCPKSTKKILIKSDGAINFMPGALDDLAFREYELIGFDKNIDLEKNKINTHRSLMRNGCVILKNLDLEKVETGEYFLLAMPLKTGEFEASPTRAVLLTDYINWSPRKDNPLTF